MFEKNLKKNVRKNFEKFLKNVWKNYGKIMENFWKKGKTDHKLWSITDKTGFFFKKIRKKRCEENFFQKKNVWTIR